MILGHWDDKKLKLIQASYSSRASYNGVEKVWDNLRQEIVLIYSRKFTEAKKNLICNTCSRAKGNWTNLDQSEQDQQQHSTSQKTGIALEHVQN